MEPNILKNLLEYVGCKTEDGELFQKKWMEKKENEWKNLRKQKSIIENKVNKLRTQLLQKARKVCGKP